MSLYGRGNAVIDQTCDLRSIFKIGDTKYNPYQVRLCEIYSSDPDVGSPTAVASYTPTNESLGTYIITVAASILPTVGLYYDKWYYIWESGETETNVIQDFYVSRSTALDLVGELRVMMRDTHPTTARRRYTDDELQEFLYNAIDDINATAPAMSVFTIDNYAESVPAWKYIIKKGAQVFALISQGILEIGKEFNYNDNGLSITFNRSAKYQSMANMLLQNYETQKLAAKRQYFMDSSAAGAILGPEDISTLRLRTFSSRTSRIR